MGKQVGQARGVSNAHASERASHTCKQGGVVIFFFLFYSFNIILQYMYDYGGSTSVVERVRYIAPTRPSAFKLHGAGG